MMIKNILSSSYIPLTDTKHLSQSYQGVFVTDLLSQAIHSAKPNNLLITIISNPNTIAVAMMLDLPCIIICSSKKVTEAMIDKANEEEITIISTDKHEHEVIIDLYQRGLL